MIVLYVRAWVTERKTRTLTTASASGCRACCSRPTETASWKRGINLPTIGSLQLVEHVYNAFREVAF